MEDLRKIAGDAPITSRVRQIEQAWNDGEVRILPFNRDQCGVIGRSLNPCGIAVAHEEVERRLLAGETVKTRRAAYRLIGPEQWSD